MAEYVTAEESWERHKDFLFDTEEEGKNKRRHFGFLRVKGIMDRVPMGSHVLEMGCNSGGLSMILMRERSCFCHGVDVAPHMVERAVKKGIPAKVCPAEKTGYEDGKFDVVVASELLEHVFDPSEVLREAHRVLRPGGKIVGSVPHERSFTTKKRPIAAHRYHCRVYRKGLLKKVLNKYFGEIEMAEIPFLKEPTEGLMINPFTKTMIRCGTPQWYLFSAVKR